MPVLRDATTKQSTVVPTARRATGSAQGAAARVVSRSGAGMGPASILALQRAAGNGAVAAMVARQRESSPSGSTPEPALAAGLPEWERAGIGPEPAREGDSPDEADYAGRQPGEEAVPHAKSGAAAAKMTAADEPAARFRLQRCGAGCTSADGHPTGTLEEGAADQPDTLQPVAAQRLAATDPSTIHSDPAAPTEAPLLRATKHGPSDRRSASAPVADDAAVSRPVARDDLDGHLDLLTGAALVGAPVLQAARRAGQAVSLQRLSLNPLDWAKKVWNGIRQLGSGALEKARSMGSGALARATELGSRVTSAVGSAVTGALSGVAAAARSGASRLGDAARSALQTLGGVARQGLAAAGKVARGSLDGALRLGRMAWNKASAVGRQALDVAMRAGRSVVDAGTSLSVRAWSAVKGKVGGLWDGLKAKAGALRKKVMNGAQGLLAKAKALGGRALTAAQGLAGRIGGSICDTIGRATAWVYGKVAPLARQAWDWVKANPAKTIAMLLTPGGPLIALGTVLQTKMLALAKQVFGPVVNAIAGKARAAWSTAKRWGAKAFSTAKQWAGKAWDGAKALGSRALSAAGAFGRSVVGKAKSLGGAVIGKAREWGGRVFGKAKQLGANVWGKAKELGGRLLGVADSLTGGLASKVKGLAAKILGKASGVLSWVMDKAQGLASRALASARALASKVLSKAKALASRAWGKAKALGSTLASRAKEFAAGALTKGKAMLARAGQVAVDFGKKALQGAKGLAARALTTAKGWGSKAWATAKDWGGKAWTKAKELGGRAWRGIKARAGQAWDLAKGIGARLAPYARQAWEEAKRIGKAIGVDKAIAAVVSIKDKTLTLAKQGLVLLKNKVLPMVEKLRQARNSLMSYSLAGVLCKGVGCAYRGFIPRKGGKDLESGLDLATDIIPVVSTVKDTCTCLVGENFVTNKAVGGGEQGLACTFAALDVVGYVGSTVSGGAATAGVVGLRAAVKGGIKVGGKIIAEEALEALIKQGGRGLAEKLGKEGLQELAEKLGKEGLQELAEKMGKEEFQKLAEEAAARGVKSFDDVMEKGAKEAAEAAGEKGAKEGAETTVATGAKEVVHDGRKVVLDPEPGVKAAAEGANGHTIKVTESGRLMVCTICDDLDQVYRFELRANPELAEKLADARKLPADKQAAEVARLQGELNRLATGPTVPGGTADPSKLPSGKPAVPKKPDKASKRAALRENESADLLAKAGYTVKQSPTVPGPKNPDYLVEGRIFDCYAPSTDKPRNIWKNTLDDKIITHQADRIILNLDDSSVDLDKLRKQFHDWPMPGLKELIVVKDGKVIPFWP